MRYDYCRAKCAAGPWSIFMLPIFTDLRSQPPTRLSVFLKDRLRSRNLRTFAVGTMEGVPEGGLLGSGKALMTRDPSTRSLAVDLFRFLVFSAAFEDFDLVFFSTEGTDAAAEAKRWSGR